MLTRISIQNFKCFEEVDINLAPLTLLSGTNSSGKSTVIQALRLIVQNISYPNSKHLDGEMISIGEFSEARNFITNAKQFKIGVHLNKDILEYLFKESESKDGSLEILHTSKTIEDLLNVSNKRFKYLSENRIGAQNLYDSNSKKNEDFGNDGQWVIDYFEKNKSKPIEDYLIKDKKSVTLATQVNYWLEQILNSTIKTEDIGSNKIKAEYYRKDNPERAIKPKNIGSGLSYIIGILVICLSAKKGDIIAIENPEIHLHNKVQSRLTEFLIFIANAGIQLIIETHSDHIFNRCRIAVAKKELKLDDISLNYFEIKNNESLTTHHRILLDEYGRVKNQIDGLFDQFDEDLNSLLGI